MLLTESPYSKSQIKKTADSPGPRKEARNKMVFQQVDFHQVRKEELHTKTCFLQIVHTPNAKSRTQQTVLGPERRPIKKIVFQEAGFHPVRKEELDRKTCSLQKVHTPKAKSRTQQTVLGPERKLIQKIVFEK